MTVAAVSTPPVASLPRPDEVPGLPLVGHALALRYDPLDLLVDLYRKRGPIFTLRAAHRRLTILAGLDANLFLMKAGEAVFSSERLFGGMGREMGTDTFLVALDGEPHRHIRKQMRRGFSRSAARPFVPGFLDVVEQATSHWKPGDVVRAVPFFQRLVTDQLSDMLSGERPGDMFDNIFTFLNTLMNVEVLKTWPRVMLHRPAYRKARARCLALGEAILERHIQSGPSDPPDLVDDVIQMTTVDGKPFTREAQVAASIGPYFAGMDTVAATLSFIMYGALHDRKVKDAVMGDADRAMAATDSLFDDLKGYEDLHACILETMRLWPVVPFTPRSAASTFEFAGRRVEAGEDVMVAQAVTHLLDEHFPDARRFDLDRHKAPRFEARQKAVYAPFTLGAHACLGAGLAEVQIAVTMAALFHLFDLELEHKDQPMRVVALPVPSPGRRFAFRVKARR